MTSFIILKNEGPQDENRWTNGIHKFLSESGALVTPETIEELGKQILSTLGDKATSGQLEEPEFTMALLEAVLPLCPTTSTKTAMSLKASASILASTIRAMQELVIAAQTGVPNERLRLAAASFNEFVKKSKVAMGAHANSVKAHLESIKTLQAKGSELLNKLESHDIISELVDERFTDLGQIIELRKAVEEPDYNAKEHGGIGAEVVRSAYDQERKARQRVALDFYLVKAEIAALKSAVYSVSKIKTIFDRIPTIEIERGARHPGMFDYGVLGNYIENKIPLEAERLGAQEAELRQTTKVFDAIYNYMSSTKGDDVPVVKLIELLPTSDWHTKNFIKLMDLEEIYQFQKGESLGTEGTQKAKPEIGLNKSSVTYDEFVKSLVGTDVSKYIDSTQKEKIEAVLGEVSKGGDKEMTWRKGMAVYLFSDPPNWSTVRQLQGQEVSNSDWGQTTLGGEAVDVEKGAMPKTMTPDEINKLKIEKSKASQEADDARRKLKKAKSPEKIKELTDIMNAAKAKRDSIGNILKDLGDTSKAGGYDRRGATVGRRLFEANRPDAHWINLLNAVRPAHINRKTVEQDLETINTFAEVANAVESEVRDKKVRNHLKRRTKKITQTMDQLLGTPGVETLSSKDLVMTAIDNESTPSWILMRAIQYPFDRETSSLAEANLEARGWTEKKDASGAPMEDEFGDKVWELTSKAPESPKPGKKAPEGAKKAPSKAPVAPKAAPKAKPAKPKKSFVISPRERIAQDMSRNLDQQVDMAKKMADDAAQQQKLLEQERQLKINAPKNIPSPAGQTPPTTPTAGQPQGTNPGVAPIGTIPQGVGVGGVKTFGSSKSKLSKRG
jgi:hypothetical protein